MRAKKNLFQLLTKTRLAVYISFITFMMHDPGLAEEIVELEPVVIVSSRIIAEEQESRVPARSQDVIVVDDKKAISETSVPAILEKFSLTDVRTRGAYGVQADISIRGTTFEENLVLLDGISINDPKSGHHNMDLPITLFDVERIDLTYGPASSVYGSGAIGGAVNIIPKAPEDKIGFFASSSIGSWDFLSEAASVNIPIGAVKNRTSVEWKRSSGYKPETEFNALTVSSYSTLDLENLKADLFMGYLTKKFGANKFYSNSFPDEEESINTGLIIAKGETEYSGVIFKPAVYWKRLQDKFILDRNRPGFSRNDHTTHIYGGELISQIETSLGDIVIGETLGGESMESTSMDNRDRLKGSVFAEYENKFSKLSVNCTARIDYYSTFGFEFSPSANLSYEIFSNLSVRSGISRAFRAPSFTDLYYRSAANIGNEDLNPETAWVYDTGINYKSDGLEASAGIFLRDAENIIDWTRASSSNPWQAQNIGKFDMYGLETSLGADFDKFMPGIWLKKAVIKYGYLEGLEKEQVTSKYVLKYLKHNFNLNVSYNLPFKMTGELDFSFRKRIGDEGYFLLDSAVFKDIEIGRGTASFFLKLSNIFNTAYVEEGSLDMPGFAAYAGASAKF